MSEPRAQLGPRSTGGDTVEAAPREWWALPAEDAAALLDVDVATGLSSEEAARRLEGSGPNELDPPKRTSLLATFVDAATEPFVIVLAIAGGLAIALGEVRDGLLVLLGLIPIVGADVVTAYRGERALEELREAAAPRAHVRRDGDAVEIPARDLVQGDVVRLRVGDVVPADLRVARAAALTVDRSILTGESLPEELRPEPDPAGAPLADRRAMAHAGTSVVLGSGEGFIVAIGRDTELGRIASALGPTDRGRSPLQRELDRLVRILLVVAIGLIAITTGLALVRGETLGEALLAGISAAIAAIPEEPPVLLAVILGLGAYRLLRRGVLVRRLNAQETLGSVDLIVTDKTGTLTYNRLSLESIITSDETRRPPADAAAVVRDAIRAEEDAWGVDEQPRYGSFTRALVAASGVDAVTLDRTDLIEARSPRPDAPFSFTRARRNGSIEELALGAPEAVLALGDEATAERWRVLAERTAGSGKRLLLLSRRIDQGAWQPTALLSFVDTLRPGIAEALREASEAGIQTIVVTGDHPATAATIAREAGLRGNNVVTGTQLDAMTDDELAAAMRELEVVARATPEQKLRLVRVAKTAGRTIAVTGDGVNDAPALQQADVAVAMGSGTAVAREAADLVLGDDSFATLMNGLREGRRIVANVEKGLVFLTSTHVALLGFILVATVVGFAQPLLPIQILWLELFIDFSASVAFEREPAEPDVMRHPPRRRGVPLLTWDLLLRVTIAGGITGVAALALMSARGVGFDHARWLAFTTLVFAQLVRAYENRSLTFPVRSLPVNGLLLTACVVGAVVQLAIPYVPALAAAFRAEPLALPELGLVALIAFLPAVVAEIVRSVRKTTWVA